MNKRFMTEYTEYIHVQETYEYCGTVYKETGTQWRQKSMQHEACNCRMSQLN